MHNFKLLAVRPLKGCDKKYLKNLLGGEIYSIYSSYKFYNDNLDKVGLEENVSFISKNEDIPKELYSIKSADDHPINVNISAISGKNGSGKSSLVELFFAAVYMTSVNYKLLGPNLTSLLEENPLIKNDLKLANQQLKEFLKGKEKSIKDFELNPKEKFSDIESIINKFNSDEQSLIRQKAELEKKIAYNISKVKEINQAKKNLKAEIYFQLSNQFYMLKVSPDEKSNGVLLAIIPEYYSDGQVKTKAKTVNIRRNFPIKNFFYTIAINYSHYSLNARFLGDWINSLFHKNDGYTTPLVINPMRIDGNFDINDEIGFAKYRLLSNLLIQNFKGNSESKDLYLTDNQFVDKVVFKLNKAKTNRIPKLLRSSANKISGDARSNNMLTTFLSDYFKTKELIAFYKTQFALKDILINYIVQKIDNIPKRYPGFGIGYQFTENTPFPENDKFFQALKEDESHITFKLKQAVNFLKYCTTMTPDSPFWINDKELSGNLKIEKRFSLFELMDWMAFPSGYEIIRLLPPSIFEVDFLLSNKGDSKTWFSSLSSGEQQLIHTTQSVLYHLNNIQSVHFSRTNRAKYEAINIIFDEIELYFHPEYQRKFIDFLLRALSGLYVKEGSRINTINILFLTHSPFILSDIPKQNIMRLEIDKKHGKSVPSTTNVQTFAANIHDLLSDSFFLEGTLIGKFAELQLNELIDKIKSKAKLNNDDEKLIAMIGDSFLRLSFEQLKKRND